MKARIVISLIMLGGLATLSPAPIRDPRTDAEKPKYLGRVSEKDQFATGRYPQVGELEKRNADGTGPQETLRNDADGKAVANLESATPVHSDPRAVKNLTHAEKVLEEEKSGGGWWITALIALLVGFGSFWALRMWLEKNGPAPKSGFKPAPAKGSSAERG